MGPSVYAANPPCGEQSRIMLSLRFNLTKLLNSKVLFQRRDSGESAEKAENQQHLN